MVADDTRSTDRIAKFKLLESKRAAYRFFRELTKPYISPWGMKRLMTGIFISTSKLDRYIKDIDSYEGGKTVNGMVINDPNEDTEFMRRWKRDVLMQWNERIRSLEDLTQIATLFVVEDFGKPWALFSSAVWISWMKPGRIGVVLGDLGSGKTDLACTLIELVLDNGEVVVSNVRSRHAIDRYIYERTMSGALIAFCEAKMAEKEVLFVFDEGAVNWVKIETVKGKNITKEKVARLFRKMGVKLIYIAQYAKDVPTMLMRYKTAFFKKNSLKIMDVEIRGGVVGNGGKGVDLPPIDDRITWVPKTKFPFITEDIATFVVDINLDYVLDFLAGLEEGEDQYEALAKHLRSYLEGHRWDILGQLTRSQRDALILWMATRIHPDGKKVFSYREIGSVVELSPPQLSRIVNRNREQYEAVLSANREKLGVTT